MIEFCCPPAELRSVMPKLMPAVVVTASLFPSVAVAQTNLPVFADGLGAGWQNWSWSTTVSFASASPTYGGSAASVSVHYTAAWAGLYLHNDSYVSTVTYTSLRFQ